MQILSCEHYAFVNSAQQIPEFFNLFFSLFTFFTKGYVFYYPYQMYIVVIVNLAELACCIEANDVPQAAHCFLHIILGDLSKPSSKSETAFIFVWTPNLAPSSGQNSRQRANNSSDSQCSC
jgi:hypothetical protein